MAMAYVASNDLASRVSFYGARPHDFVRQAMAKSDLYLQHSLTDPQSGDEEGLPVAILEAMASGMPIVSTRHAGIPDAVIEGEQGLLCDEGDVDAMAAHLVTLAADSELRRKMGAAGRARVAENYTQLHEMRKLREAMGLS